MNGIQYAYTFDDISLVPQYNNVPSRTIPTLDSWITNKTELQCPIIPSNMDSVISDEMADILIANGSMPIFHRFTDEEQQFEWAKKYGNKCYLSCGVNNMDLTVKLIKETSIRGVCIDIAHGHCETMKNFMIDLRRKVGNDPEIISGNICTPQAYQDLVNWGADAVKVGIGGGCFKGDTRILMANGVYKNIEDILPGDLVINMHGKYVKVINKVDKGLKDVIKVKTGACGDDIIVTPDHRFYIGELSEQSNSQMKTEWKEIQNCNSDNTLLLFPTNIDWCIPDSFTLSDYSQGKQYDASYEMGYIFGTYFGDTELKFNLDTTKTGKICIHWHIKEHDEHIMKKINTCLEKVFNIKASFQTVDNVKIMVLYHDFLVSIFEKFGKGNGKQLNELYYCVDKKYIKGLFDGLTDLSGNIIPHKDCNMYYFSNTNKLILELYKWCALNLDMPLNICKSRTDDSYGYYYISIQSNNEVQNINMHNTKNFTCSNILEKTNISGKERVWDIEVDCPTHSFIANNVIVHNSACSTRMVTGFGVPQWTAIYECGHVANKLRVPMIADGGIRNSRDVALALAAGASTVMAGGVFSNTYESAAIKETVDGNTYSKYRGQASSDFQKDYYGEMKTGTVAEGVAFHKLCNRSVQDVINDLTGGLRSAMTYGGAKNIKEFQRKAEFRFVTSNYMAESKPRPENKGYPLVLN